MPLFGETVQSISGSRIIGHYFTVVSFIPSTVFTTYFLLLLRSGAWGTGRVDLVRGITTLDLKDAVALGFGSLLLALALHPLQFTFVQIFEGYWGASVAAAHIAAICTMRHRRVWRKMRGASERYAELTEHSPGQRRPPMLATSRATVHDVRSLIIEAERSRTFGYYPERLEQVMPTRLGNVLRMHESRAGRVYGLSALTAVPRLMLVGDQKHVDYVQDQRTSLDLAIRTVVLSLGATIMTVIFMWSRGPWLLVALAPYGVAYCAYRGAIRAAYEYGLAVTMLIDFNRFALYEKMHLPMPETLAREVARNAQLNKLFSTVATVNEQPKRLRYQKTDKVSTAGNPTPPEAKEIPNANGSVVSSSDGGDA